MKVKRVVWVLFVCSVLFLTACAKREQAASEQETGQQPLETANLGPTSAGEITASGEVTASEQGTKEKYVQENLGRDEEAVERFLETFPQEYVDIRDEGRAACASYMDFWNSHLWETFLAQVKGGKEACVVVASPTTEGDPILQYIHFDGTDYWVVHDSHRDHFGTPGYGISKFRYMSEFRTAGYDDYEVVLANESLNSSEERTAYWDRIYAEYYEDEYKEPIDEDGYILAPFTLLYTRWK
jgi:hypothetical protein